MKILQRRIPILFVLLTLVVVTPLLADNAQPPVRVIVIIETGQVVKVHLQREAGMVRDGGNEEGDWWTDKAHSPYWGQFRGDSLHDDKGSRSIYFGIRKTPNDNTFVRRYWISCTRSIDSTHPGKCYLEKELTGNAPSNGSPDPMVKTETRYIWEGNYLQRLELTFRIIGNTN